MMTWMLVIAAALTSGQPLVQADELPEQVVRKAIKNVLPGAKIDVIEKAPIPGYYQAIARNQLIYVTGDGRYLLKGTLYDGSSKRDLTEGRLALNNRVKLDAVPASKRLVFAPEKPSYKVTVFTDIDCSYCRKMHLQIAEYNKRGIQVDYLLFPRSGLSGASFDRAVSVWCAKDRRAAFTAAKAGQVPEAMKCENPITEQFKLGIEVGVTGTPAVFAPNGAHVGGYLTPDQLLGKLRAVSMSQAPR